MPVRVLRSVANPTVASGVAPLIVVSLRLGLRLGSGLGSRSVLRLALEVAVWPGHVTLYLS